MPTIGELVTNLSANFTLAEAMTVLKPLSLFMLGMVVYAIFIFKFYRFVAKRDVFAGSLIKYKGGHPLFHAISYVIEYIIAMPIVIYVWLVILATIMTFLSRTQSIENILMVAVALVGSIRITSYYKEELSRDLAKMLPFAMLGILLLDVAYFSPSTSIEMLKLIPTLWKTSVYYLAFIFVIETVLRIAHIIGRKKKTGKKEEKIEPAPQEQTST